LGFSTGKIAKKKKCKQGPSIAILAMLNKWRFFFVVYFSVFLHTNDIIVLVNVYCLHYLLTLDRDVRETFFASVCNQFWIKEKLNWTVRLWFSHSGCLTKFQQNIQKLILIEKSICWVFLIEVFEVGLRSSLIGTCLPIILNKHWFNTTKVCW
jgi:hypothetical protein